MDVTIHVNSYVHIKSTNDETKMMINITGISGEIIVGEMVNIDDLRCAIRKLVAK